MEHVSAQALALTLSHAPELLLAFGLGSLAFALNASRPLRWPAPAALAAFFAGWLTDELALHHLALQVAVVSALVWLGGLATPFGQAGLLFAALSSVVLLLLFRRAGMARGVMERALAGHDELVTAFPWTSLAAPFPVGRAGVARVADVVFHREGRLALHLDVHASRAPATGRPVLIYVHGGGWVVGQRKRQGLPLMQHLAAHGWVCFSVDYRLSPRATFPDHLVDVKRAIAWVRAHAEEYGADPSFLAIAGNSAGAHLAALAALTPNEPVYQPGFESADTRLQACVPFYGIYDFADRHGHWPNDGMRGLLETMVMKATRAEAPEAYEAASPITRVHADAPPFLIVHGDGDSLVPVDEARRFSEALARVSSAPVAYAEIPGAQHAFEVFPSRRTASVVQGVAAFLASARAKRSS